MKEFPVIPATKMSVSKRMPIYGIGINDAHYKISSAVNGRRILCPFYLRWKEMIRRCYSESFHDKQPTYKECSVCEEWLTFSNFRSWMTNQDWQNKDLDKDIKFSGNKIYSPDTCIFVAHEINMLTCDSLASRGKWPLGVYFNKQSNKFMSRCVVNNKLKYLGLFCTSLEASKVYKEFKSKLILSVAKDQEQPLKSYLVRIAAEVAT
jgi:hypothetical protein